MITEDERTGMGHNFWKMIRNENDYEMLPVSRQDCRSIHDTQNFTPEGAYTTFRTYDRYKVLNLSQHFSRLEETSSLAGFQISLLRLSLKKRLTEIIDQFDEGELRIRLTVDLTNEIGTIYAAIEKLTIPSLELYQNGIEVISTRMHRENPKAKLNNFLEKADEAKKSAGRDYEEIIMVNEEDEILEGLSSNFYGIQNQKIFTAEKGVLSGTTRNFILKLAEKVAIPVILEPIRLNQIGALDEAFITSTSRSILPICSIDKVKIGSKVPGELTMRLMKSFRLELEFYLEDLRY